MAHLRLRKDLTERPTPARWPEGIGPVLLDKSNSMAVYVLLADAFAGFPPREQWYSCLIADSECDPALCVVALTESGEVAGYMQSWTANFVKDLVVAPVYR